MTAAQVASRLEVKERLDACIRKLTTGNVVDPHELGRLRGWLEAIRFIEQLDIPGSGLPRDLGVPGSRTIIPAG